MPTKKDLNSLIEPGLKNESLKADNTRDQIPSRINRSRFTEAASAGLQSPITEVSRVTTSNILSDSTGTIFYNSEHLDQLISEDSNGIEEVRNFAPVP